MTRSNPRLRQSVTELRRFSDDLAVMSAENLWRVCDSACEIAAEGVAQGSLEHLAALAPQLPLIFAELRSRA